MWWVSKWSHLHEPVPRVMSLFRNVFPNHLGAKGSGQESTNLSQVRGSSLEQPAHCTKPWFSDAQQYPGSARIWKQRKVGVGSVGSGFHRVTAFPNAMISRCSSRQRIAASNEASGPSVLQPSQLESKGHHSYKLEGCSLKKKCKQKGKRAESDPPRTPASCQNASTSASWHTAWQHRSCFSKWIEWSRGGSSKKAMRESATLSSTLR